MKVYRVYFRDAKDGGFNQKLLEAESLSGAVQHVTQLGHHVLYVEEVC